MQSESFHANHTNLLIQTYTLQYVHAIAHTHTSPATYTHTRYTDGQEVDTHNHVHTENICGIGIKPDLSPEWTRVSWVDTLGHGSGTQQTASHRGGKKSTIIHRNWLWTGVGTNDSSAAQNPRCSCILLKNLGIIWPAVTSPFNRRIDV